MALPEIVKPSSMPRWLARGHEHQDDDVYGHAEMSTGHSRTRRLFTTADRRVTVEAQLSPAQMADFHAWHEQSLEAGLRPYADLLPAFGPGLVWFEALLLAYRTTPARGRRTRLSCELLLRGEPSVTGPVISSARSLRRVALTGSASLQIPAAASSLKRVALEGSVTASSASLRVVALDGNVADGA